MSARRAPAPAPAQGGRLDVVLACGLRRISLRSAPTGVFVNLPTIPPDTVSFEAIKRSVESLDCEICMGSLLEVGPGRRVAGRNVRTRCDADAAARQPDCPAEPADLALTACCHLFHRNCLLDWCQARVNLMKTPACPICRADVEPYTGPFKVDITPFKMPERIREASVPPSSAPPAPMPAPPETQGRNVRQRSSPSQADVGPVYRIPSRAPVPGPFPGPNAPPISEVAQMQELSWWEAPGRALPTPGRRIAVWWDCYARWFHGVVVQMGSGVTDPRTTAVRVRYSETHWRGGHLLRTKPFRLDNGFLSRFTDDSEALMALGDDDLRNGEHPYRSSRRWPNYVPQLNPGEGFEVWIVSSDGLSGSWSWTAPPPDSLYPTRRYGDLSPDMQDSTLRNRRFPDGDNTHNNDLVHPVVRVIASDFRRAYDYVCLKEVMWSRGGRSGRSNGYVSGRVSVFDF